MTHVTQRRSQAARGSRKGYKETDREENSNSSKSNSKPDQNDNTDTIMQAEKSLVMVENRWTTTPKGKNTAVACCSRECKESKRPGYWYRKKTRSSVVQSDRYEEEDSSISCRQRDLLV